MSSVAFWQGCPLTNSRTVSCEVHPRLRGLRNQFGFDAIFFVSHEIEVRSSFTDDNDIFRCQGELNRIAPDCIDKHSQHVFPVVHDLYADENNVHKS